MDEVGDSNNLRCKIISTTGQEIIEEIQISANFLLLKNKIVQDFFLFKFPLEFFLFFSGRAIKIENDKISSIVKSSTTIFFINSFAVHAACCRD